jgi:hypothetical protein
MNTFVKSFIACLVLYAIYCILHNLAGPALAQP